MSSFVSLSEAYGLIGGLQANVFLREGSSTPYLADFGVSHQVKKGAFTRVLDTSGVDAIGSVSWMPPELLRLPDNVTKVTYTTKSDVWSFGMTIYVSKLLSFVEGELTDNTQEIVSRKDPWAQDVTKGLTKAEDIKERIITAMKSSRLPKWPSLIPHWQSLQTDSNRLHTLHEKCCEYVPDKRLTTKKVVDELDNMFPGRSRVHYSHRK